MVAKCGRQYRLIRRIGGRVLCVRYRCRRRQISRVAQRLHPEEAAFRTNGGGGGGRRVSRDYEGLAFCPVDETGLRSTATRLAEIRRA